MSEETPATVLIVEDDESLRDFLAIVLSREGYRTAFASNGKEALASVAASAPSIIATDMMMPDMGGFEFIKQAQADFPEIPIIVITARKFDPAMKRDLENEPNVVAVLGKPLVFPKLVQALLTASKK